ncbi:MAG: hypothetical protein ACTHQ3_07405 [Motilibacteraceae bacterium]
MPAPAGRDNGLSAASYHPLVDLDPHLADAVLDLLADAGIAAYATPAVDHRALTELPARMVDRPLDRVYVDAVERSRARLLVDGHLPGLRAEAEETAAREAAERTPSTVPVDDDAAWAALVASFDAPVVDEVPRWSVLEDVDDDVPGPGRRMLRRRTDRDAEDGTDPGAWPGDAVVEGAPGDDAVHADTRTDPPADERSYAQADDDHYVPPPPPPLPRTDAVTRWAWTGLVGVPAAAVVVSLLGWQLDGWMLVFVALSFIAGFVTLVARMKDHPPVDDGPDDGAVV